MSRLGVQQALDDRQGFPNRQHDFIMKGSDWLHLSRCFIIDHHRSSSNLKIISVIIY